MSRKLTYGTLGALLGISAYRKLDTNSRLLPLLVAVLLAINVIKWIVFGRLREFEIRNLRHNIQYTLWEFCFTGILYYVKATSRQGPQFVLKFAGLFACVLLLKCFHYLASERASNSVDVFCSHSTNRPRWILMFSANDYLVTRFAFGLILLLWIDGLLILKFLSELSKHLIEENILLGIFGFEILHMAPLITLTLLKFALNCHHRLCGCQYNEQIEFVAEFVANLVRFVLVVVFAVIFLYLYTFPLHILPSSYLLLRVLVDRLRALLNYHKKQLKLEKLLSIPSSDQGNCTICLCDDDGEWRELKCRHQYHHDCLRHWMLMSPLCPVCRSPI